MWPNPQFPDDLVTFTEEILNGKLHFLFSDGTMKSNIIMVTSDFTTTFLITRLQNGLKKHIQKVTYKE